MPHALITESGLGLGLLSCESYTVLFLADIMPPCHWLAILGFILQEELESCLIHVYKMAHLVE